jgi:hypothetical protein
MPNVSQICQAVTNTKEMKPAAALPPKRLADKLSALSAYMEHSSPRATVHDNFLAGYDAGHMDGFDRGFDAALSLIDDCLQLCPPPVAGEVS